MATVISTQSRYGIITRCVAASVLLGTRCPHPYLHGVPFLQGAGEPSCGNTPAGRVKTLHPSTAGVPNLQDLTPDDLRQSRCNNSRNKVPSKCNALESSRNHQLPRYGGRLSSAKAVPGAEKVGDLRRSFCHSTFTERLLCAGGGSEHWRYRRKKTDHRGLSMELTLREWSRVAGQTVTHLSVEQVVRRGCLGLSVLEGSGASSPEAPQRGAHA